MSSNGTLWMYVEVRAGVVAAVAAVAAAVAAAVGAAAHTAGSILTRLAQIAPGQGPRRQAIADITSAQLAQRTLARVSALEVVAGVTVGGSRATDASQSPEHLENDHGNHSASS